MLARSMSVSDHDHGSMLDEDDAPRSVLSDQRRKVRLHFGPCEWGYKGLRIKPKFSFGFQGGAFYAVAGVRDLREGFAVEAWACLYLSYAGLGSSLEEFLESVHATDRVPVLDTVLPLVPRLLALVLRVTGISVRDDAHEVAGVVLAYVGLGATAGIFVGLPDRAGYHMLGVEGTLASGLGVGATVKAGVHASGKSMRLVAWLGNFGLDVTVSLREPCQPGGRSASSRALLPEQMPMLSREAGPDALAVMSADVEAGMASPRR